MSKIKLSIAEPCHQSWANMQPGAQGRFCNSCNKNVIDFSVMDDREVYNTLLNGAADTCGRLTPRQLNGVIKFEEEKRQRWHKYFFGFLVPAILFTKHAAAQNKMGKVAATTTVCNTVTMGLVARVLVQKHFELSGVIVDSATKEVIGNATIQIKEDRSGTTTDSAGRFKLSGKTGMQTVTIIISTIGYETKEITIAVPVNNIRITDETIMLHKSANLLGEVSVTGYGTQHLWGPLGGIGMCVKATRYSIAKSRVQTLINDSLKIFPNPVERGATFTASLKLKQTGRYIVQVTNVTGYIVLQQQINTVAALHRQMLQSSATWNAGIYFLRVIGNGNKLAATSRFMVR